MAFKNLSTAMDSKTHNFSDLAAFWLLLVSKKLASTKKAMTTLPTFLAMNQIKHRKGHSWKQLSMTRALS